MRLPVGFALLLAAAPSAHADNFVELAGGIMTPVSDDTWTDDYVDSGLKLAARAGSYGAKAGALVWLDWTPISEDETTMPLGSVDVSSHRFRMMIGATTLQKAGAKLNLSFRLGIGLDLTYVNIHAEAFGFESDDTDWDPGLGLEAAGGLWFDVGSVMVGGEIGVPISLHDDGDDNNIDLDDYTSVDIDLLFGVRWKSQ